MRFAGLMEGYFGSGRRIEMVFSLIDMRHSPTADDLDMLRFLLNAALPFCVVLTKSDKLSKTEREKRMAALSEELRFLPQAVRMIPFSAVSGEGVEEIREIIEGTVV